MARFTKAQRDYQAALLDGGLPEVLAFMAARRLTGDAPWAAQDAVVALWRGFIWSDTDEGNDFWLAVVCELLEGGA